MSDILLGSETWEITVTCVTCNRTEIMYVPTDMEVTDVRSFLITRGWRAHTHEWVCPNHGGSND